MRIEKREETIVENTIQGKKFMKEYERRLRDQGAFRGLSEDTHCIKLYATYFNVKMDEDEDYEGGHDED